MKDIESGLCESTNLGESGTFSQLLDSTDQRTEVPRSDKRVSDKLDQISDDDTGHTLSVGRSFFESSGKEGDHNGQCGTGDFGDESGRGETFDCAGDSLWRSHSGDEGSVMFENVRVRESSTEGSSGLDSGGRDLSY